MTTYFRATVNLTGEDEEYVKRVLRETGLQAGTWLKQLVRQHRKPQPSRRDSGKVAQSSNNPYSLLRSFKRANTVAFTSDHVLATDGHAWLGLSLCVPGAAGRKVEGKKFVRALLDDAPKFTVEGDVLHVQCGASTTELTTTRTADFVNAPPPDLGYAIDIAPLAAVLPFAPSPDESPRFSHVSIRDDNAMATNRRLLARAPVVGYHGPDVAVPERAVELAAQIGLRSALLHVECGNVYLSFKGGFIAARAGSADGWPQAPQIPMAMPRFDAGRVLEWLRPLDMRPGDIIEFGRDGVAVPSKGAKLAGIYPDAAFDYRDLAILLPHVTHLDLAGFNRSGTKRLCAWRAHGVDGVISVNDL
jgi:hypothetical protein